MDTAVVIVCVVLLLFGLVVFFGAPYLPTMRSQIAAAFELLALKTGDTVLELGCGDGRVLIEAAKRGYNAVGIELNIVLVIVALWRTRRYRSQVKVYWGNYWKMQWPKSEAVFTFLINSYMPKLDERMQARGGRLASVAFQVPGRTADGELDGVYLYIYDKPLA